MLRTDQAEIFARLDQFRREWGAPRAPRNVVRGLLNELYEGRELYPSEIEELSERVDAWLETQREASSERRDMATDRDWEFLAGAAIDGERAEQEPQVVAFRARHLSNSLLAGKEVDGWLRALEASEGRGTMILEVPIPRRCLRGAFPVNVRDLARILVDFPADSCVGGHSELLEYGVPGNRWPRHVAVARGGKTDELKRAAAALTAEYGWQEGDAVVFILTGAVPLPPIARFTADPLKPARQITIVVDARCAPARLAKRFAEVRNSVLGVQARGQYKPIASERSMYLALFTLAHKEGTWAERRRLWNADHPDWRYSDVSTFQRDVQRVLAHLSQRR
jgi:hypothetical protein